MTYSLVTGAQNYNNRLHYSLYGGVEYFPDHSLAFKELLPLAAIPAVAIAFLVAILNFHIPKISPQSGGSSGGLNRAGAGSSLNHLGSNGLSDSNAASHPVTSQTSGSSNTQHAYAPTSVTVIPTGTAGPISSGSDNGQGIVAGRGGDGGSTTTAPATSIGMSTSVGSASVTTTATTQPTTSQTGGTATVPLTGTNVSLSTGL